jgi:UDP-N-acetylmuramyl pentapeptide phosphotransferase/UDP-N-acetylglucosamine-1-phosphate transferase
MTNVPIISKIFSLQSGASFFFILSIAAMVNAMNLIDGVNGLCGFVTISILTSLLFISYNTHDDLMIKTIVSTILLLIPFLVFNFPDGKIFLGDMGSYGFGALISILVIMIFGRHPNLSVWLAPFIIIYPLTELIFTIGRRFISKSFIFSPDLKHLHTLVFKAKFLQYKKSKNMKNINGMVAPYLSFLWLFPSLIIFYDYENARLVSIAALFFIVMYLFTYFSFNDR